MNGNSTMNNALRRFVLILALTSLPMAVAAQSKLQKSYSDDEIIEILRSDGYRAVEISEERVITIRVDGLTYVLFVYDDDDLQLYFGVSGYELDAEDMNTWNRTKRLSRAYIDDENDPVLEADLLANAGYTKEQFLEWFEIFSYSAREFQQFLVENDRAD
jgi:hypothetical protein